MKFITSLFVVLSLTLAVSCGGDKKKSSSDSFSNAYQVKTFDAYYSPTQQYMYKVYWDGKLWDIAQQGPGMQQLQSVYQTAYQGLLSGTSQYRIHSVKVGNSYIPMYKVRVTATRGYGVQQYPGQQYPQQYPAQQYPQQGSGNILQLQSIQLIR